MTGRRTVAIWESAFDITELNDNNLNFQFAKSVIGEDGKLIFNVVWQTQGLVPLRTISWTPVYGLNWTFDIPSPGQIITVAGVWQACALGQSYDISTTGQFTPSAGGKPNYMNIGRNNYASGPATGIYIVIGVQNPTGRFDIIYVDPNRLGLNMGSWYQPQEKCRWWYETGFRTATMISGAGTLVDSYDMSAPNPITGLFYNSTTYLYAPGVWQDSPYPPPQIQQTGLIKGEGFDTTGSDQMDEKNNQPEIKLLQDRVMSLELMLSSILQNNTWASRPYLGTITWPPNVADNVITTGNDAVCDILISKGYTTAPIWNSGQANSLINFGPVDLPPPPGNNVPLAVKADWEEAFVVISVGNPTNGGVAYINTPTTNEIMQRRKVQVKEIMDQQMNGDDQAVQS